MRQSLIMLFIIIPMLAACSALEPLDEPKPVKKIDHSAMNKAAYLGRYLLDSKDRLSVEKKTIALNRSGSGTVVAEGAAGFATADAVGVSPMTTNGGAIVSGVAVGLEAAGALIDAFGPDGSVDRFGIFYVPGNLNGRKITNAKEARSFANKTILTEVENWAKSEGRTVSCIMNCSGYAPTLKIHKNTPKNVQKYDPSDLYVGIYTSNDFNKTKPNRMLNSALGFAPEWQGDLGVLVSLHVKRDDNGNPTKTNSPNGPLANHTYLVFNSAIAHRLLRYITKNGDYVYAGNYLYGNFISTNGNLFAVNTRKGTKYVRYEIDPKTDITLEKEAK